MREFQLPELDTPDDVRRAARDAVNAHLRGELRQYPDEINTVLYGLQIAMGSFKKAAPSPRRKPPQPERRIR